MLIKFFEKYNIKESDKLLVACSGGADSMYLLSEMARIHPHDSIIVGHFNHNLRGIESDGDEIFIREYCTDKGLKLEIGSAQIKDFAKQNKLGIEEAARIKRYEFLERIRESADAKYILTAHHLDDSIETFFFNLVRGTKLGGLTGIDELNGEILRPLLHMTKSEILEKCIKENIVYRDDATNLDDTILRNHIRINIAPQFEKINPNYKKNLDDIMEYFKNLQEYIEKDVNKNINDDRSFDIKIFLSLSPFLQKELIAQIFRISNNGTIGLTKGNIDEVVRYISDKGNYTKKDIKEMHLLKKNGKIYF